MASNLSSAQKRLNAAESRKRRQDLGPTLDQSDADLTARAEVGPERLPEIEAFIRDAAGQFGVDLLRAGSYRG